ncbi:agmatine deiminase family protein [Amycolatopsis oliviviridis]|uniref:Porphyromonas-type peptidyl-arginine deiminase n=1 Tax=Amycolatopsis oliviviridis TaxID=1471590 RepID=A0ABQ3L337_9PSEU|nr:agmatine deiminase family protein [Amycolatopsis oliviviridis]GHH00882.1 porphyromonas-type peptidyl-arginine deiminase [Amycolatopsis oliviviridis]
MTHHVLNSPCLEVTVPVSRRTALRSVAGVAALAASAAACSGAEEGPADVTATPSVGPSATPAGEVRFGAEWEPQARTFMSWPTSAIWDDQTAAVQNDIAGLARAIRGHQPVVMFARPELAEDARRACGGEVEVVPIPVDDLWARDTLPVFVEQAGKLRGVNFNFSGWGNKQNPHDKDAAAAAALLEKYGIPGVRTWLVAEGGSFETDGKGTLLVTESSVVNDNRNPGKTRDQIEAELKKVLGVRKVIWFEGVRGKDITDAHIDCLVRFASPGVVLLDRAFPGSEPDHWSRSADQAKQVLEGSTDAQDQPLKVVELFQPDPDKITGRGDAFVSTYLNFYVANKAVVIPKFGDPSADGKAAQIMRDTFPGREVVQVSIDAIAAGGGGIHCATHDQPDLPPA